MTENTKGLAGLRKTIETIETIQNISPRYEEKPEGEEEHGESLAEMIVRAYQERLEEDPETVKEELEEYLEYLSPEDRIAFLKEKLEESGGQA